MPGSIFPTTRGSIVAALASEDRDQRARAFDTLTQIYRTPLLTYARVAHRHDDAEDVTQSFLVVAFERDSLASYDPQKASFRTFLRTLFDRFIANDARAAARQKRGGHLTLVEMPEAGDAPNPEELFQREWVRSVFTMTVERLRSHSDFAIFEAYDLHVGVTYRDLAQQFDITETTVTNRLAAARRAFREQVLAVLREITASETEFRSEARALLGVDV